MRTLRNRTGGRGVQQRFAFCANEIILTFAATSFAATTSDREARKKQSSQPPVLDQGDNVIRTKKRTLHVYWYPCYSQYMCGTCRPVQWTGHDSGDV